MFEVLNIIGFGSISIALLVMGRLSYRLGRVTRANAYYVWFYVAAGLVAVGATARIINFSGRFASSAELHQNVGWVLAYLGAPVAGVTLGLILAWRYWSWLLAERG